MEEGRGYFYWKQYEVLSSSQHKYSSLFFKNVLLITESLIRPLICKLVLFSQVRTNICTITL